MPEFPVGLRDRARVAIEGISTLLKSENIQLFSSRLDEDMRTTWQRSIGQVEQDVRIASMVDRENAAISVGLIEAIDHAVGELEGTIEWGATVLPQLIEIQSRQITETPPQRPRASTKKIELPWTPVSFTPAPNVHNHGTRNLASSISGGASWETDPTGGYAVVATLGNRTIARVDLTPGQEASSMLALMSRVGSPSAIKTMVAASRLVWEKTGRMPFQHAATIGIGELARAAGYEAGDGRNIDPEIRRRIVQELRALTLVETWATDSPYDKKTRRRKGEWVAPLLVVTAAYREILHAEDGPVPTEIDIMLGRNWATAYAETDLVQIPAGFMKLHDDSVIRLAWYYVMAFRYRMMKPSMVIERPIRLLCSEAEIETGQARDRGRFLERLDKWHGLLVEHRIIGSYHRTPSIGTKDEPCPERPSTVFEQGTYTVRPTQAIIDVYQKRAVEPPPAAKATRTRKVRRKPATA